MWASLHSCTSSSNFSVHVDIKRSGVEKQPLDAFFPQNGTRPRGWGFSCWGKARVNLTDEAEFCRCAIATKEEIVPGRLSPLINQERLGSMKKDPAAPFGENSRAHPFS
jgi:hypothetical protein